MNIKVVGTTVMALGKKAGFYLSKNAPIIFTGVGIAAGGFTVAVACKKTLKLDEVMSDTLYDVKRLHAAKDQIELDKEFAEKYTMEDYRHDILQVYKNGAINLIKLYWPAVLSGAVSVTCIFAGQRIINTSYVSAVAICTSTEKAFRDYRKNVIADGGEELDRKYRFSMREETTESYILDKDGNPKVDKNGEPKVKRETNTTVDGSKIGVNYTRLFGEGTTECWDVGAAYNKAFILGTMQELNDKLRKQGYLFFNDALSALGFPIVPEGQDVGWLILDDEENRDGCVDFRIWVPDEYGITPYDKLTDLNNSIVIDFNCDGYIRDKLFAAQKVFA